MGAWLMKRIGTPALYWLALAGAVLLVLMGARNAGRNAERVKQLESQVKRTEASHAITEKQLEAAAHRPRDRDELRDRLQNGRF